MKPHPTKSKPRKAKPKVPPGNCLVCGRGSALCACLMPKFAKPSPRQPGKGGRVMWQTPSGDIVYMSQRGKYGCPVLVLPLSKEARERRVEAIAKTLYSPNQAYSKESGYYCLGIMNDCIELASFVLASLGDTPAGEGRGK